MRWVFAVALVFYALKSGRLDLSELKGLMSSPLALIGTWFLLVIGLFLTLWRWQILLHGAGLKSSFGEVLRLGMIGQFFSAVIPGAVSGDLVKAVAISKRFPQSKLRAVSSIILDRVLGMGALVVLATLGFWIAGGPNLNVLPGARIVFTSLGWMLTLLSVVGVTGLLLGPWVVDRVGPWIDLKTRPVPSLNEIYRAVESYKSNWRSIWICFGISIVNHSLILVVMYCIGVLSFGDPLAELDAGTFALTTLLGQSTLALPIAPMGVGVGQVAYSTLFQMAGASSLSFGSTLVTGWQAMGLTLNLCGLGFFLASRKNVAGSQATSVRIS